MDSYDAEIDRTIVTAECGPCDLAEIVEGYAEVAGQEISGALWDDREWRARTAKRFRDRSDRPISTGRKHHTRTVLEGLLGRTHTRVMRLRFVPTSRCPTGVIVFTSNRGAERSQIRLQRLIHDGRMRLGGGRR